MVSILHNQSLKSFNTFGLDVSARYLVEVHSLDELKGLVKSEEYLSGQHLFLGGRGSQS